MILSVITLVSCTSEDSETLNLNNNPVVNNPTGNLIPDQLEGYYISPNNTSSTITISEENMILNFMPFNEQIISFSTEEVYYTETTKTFTIHYYNNIDIVLEYILNSDDLTVLYIKDGNVQQLGQYSKQ